MDEKGPCLYRNQWPLYWAVGKGLSPIGLSVGTLCAALLFTLIAAFVDWIKKNDPLFYLSYIDNISWSLSLIVLFPAILGLTLYFYEKAPKTLNCLYLTTVVSPNNIAFKKVCDHIDSRVNSRLVLVAVWSAAIILNLIYVGNMLSDPDRMESWMLCRDCMFGLKQSLTCLGLFAALIQLFLSYWVMMFVIKSLIFIRGLYEFFHHDELAIQLDPIHPDEVSGLDRLRELATLQATILLLLGLYVSLKVLDKLYQQGASLFEDIGNPVMLLAYVVVAPLMFFLILGSAHDKMKAAKNDTLGVLSEQINSLLSRSDWNQGDIGMSHLSYLEKLRQQRDALSKSISVWPFNWKSLQGFFGVVIAPLAPPIVTGLGYIADLIK